MNRTGKFAALRLGPGAGNLEGARIGAERIAWAMSDVLGKGPYGVGDEHDDDDDSKYMTDEYRYRAGIGSRFDSLKLEG